MQNLQKSAKIIGQILQSQANLAQMMLVKTPLGVLNRKGECPPNWPEPYQPKKHIFFGGVDSKPVIVIHFSGSQYGPDPDYFERMYQTARDVLSGKIICDPRRKVFPLLYSIDDPTMTLVMEKAPLDLSAYFTIENAEAIEATIDKFLQTIRFVWLVSNQSDSGWPRYVSGFLEPEYPFLKDKNVDQYLSKELTNFYQKVQGGVREFLAKIGGFKRGFGLQDCKAQNVVVDREGNVLLIDIEKAAFDYHLLSVLGHFYQTAQRDAPNSLFVEVLNKKVEELLLNPLAIQLFILGRINDLCIPLTLRNIVWNREVSHPNPEDKLRQKVEAVQKLLRASTASEALT